MAELLLGRLKPRVDDRNVQQNYREQREELASLGLLTLVPAQVPRRTRELTSRLVYTILTDDHKLMINARGGVIWTSRSSAPSI